jgi:RimJ/RimL family protein N-acetyltransferase
VVTTRADIDYVITEYGVASLKGRTIRERAMALIQIAHPDFREQLLREAKKIGYLDQDYVLPPQAERYRVDLEATIAFKRDEVFFRPIRLTDIRRLKDLFYSQSEETTYLRFGMPLKSLSEKQFRELVSIDYTNSMAIGAFVRVGREERRKMIGVGRYYALEGEQLAEAAFTVHDDYQGQGIGTFLLNYLAWIARESGLNGLMAEVLAVNTTMRALFRRCFDEVEETIEDGSTTLVLDFSKWKGSGNPAQELGAPELQ